MKKAKLSLLIPKPLTNLELINFSIDVLASSVISKKGYYINEGNGWIIFTESETYKKQNK